MATSPVYAPFDGAFYLSLEAVLGRTLLHSSHSAAITATSSVHALSQQGSPTQEEACTAQGH
eukprot:1159675-Pelagomonas_calceolata.AAC.2